MEGQPNKAIQAFIAAEAAGRLEDETIVRLTYETIGYMLEIVNRELRDTYSPRSF